MATFQEGERHGEGHQSHRQSGEADAHPEVMCRYVWDGPARKSTTETAQMRAVRTERTSPI
jgi:hypothetical protein